MENLSRIFDAQDFIILILCFYSSYRVVAYCLQAYRRSQYARKHLCKPVPSYPHIDPILGLDSLYRIIQAVRQGHLMDEIGNRFRTINGGVATYSSILMGSRNVHTIDPENVKAMLRTNWKDYHHAPARKAAFGYFGNGIFTADGPEWEVSRSILRPSFTRTQTRNLPALEEHVSNLIAQILKEGQTVDLQPLFFRFTADTIFETLMGEKLNCLPGGNNDTQLAELADAVEYTTERAGLRVRIGPIAALVLGPRFWQSLSLIKNFIGERISRALISHCGKSLVKKEHDLDENLGEHQRYVFLHEIVKRHSNADQIRAELLHVLGAGRNATASLLSVLCYTIVRQPRVLQKMREEILQQVGPNPPTYEILRNLNYLRWTINETLRLYPTSPIGSRVAIVDTILPRGGGIDGKSPVLIKAGTSVWWAAYCIHRREAFYGEDPHEFKPERWESLGDPGWNYVPFGGGPHLCPGQQFALTEVSYTMVRLLQAFSDIKPGDDSVWAEKMGLAISVRSGCKVNLTVA